MSCKDNKDGSCSVEYIPFTPGEYDVNITFGGLPIPGEASELPLGGGWGGVPTWLVEGSEPLCFSGSPFSVPVRELVDPSKVRCFGPGLGIGVRAHVAQTFTVDSSRAGLAPLVVQLYGPTGETRPG